MVIGFTVGDAALAGHLYDCVLARWIVFGVEVSRMLWPMVLWEPTGWLVALLRPLGGDRHQQIVTLCGIALTSVR